MKFLLLSDLHLEQGNPLVSTTPDNIDAVVLAGDIHQGTEGIGWARSRWPSLPIVYVAGNHEFYGHGWESTLDDMRKDAKKHNIAFLENDSTSVCGIRFLGATLWTDYELFGHDRKTDALNTAKMFMSDHRLIHAGHLNKRLMNPDDAMLRHQASRKWLERELMRGKDEGLALNTVVVTHHYPSSHSTAKPYQKQLLSAAFGSNLEDMMGMSAVWIHGHTHTSFDYEIAGTRVVCNPRGYIRNGVAENPAFDPMLVVEI
jgi:predicted phosphodiesterase